VGVAHQPVLSLRNEGPVPTSIRSAEFLSKSLRHAARCSSSVASSPSTSRLSALFPELSSFPYIRSPRPQLLPCFPYIRKNGGCTHPKMSARRHFHAFLFPSTLSVLFLFNCLRTLSFSGSPLSPIPPISSPLFTKKPGCTPLRSNHFGALPLSPPLFRPRNTGRGPLVACRWPPVAGHLPCQFVGCAVAPPCGTLVLPHRLQPNSSRG
jgi:hypothetical protein